MTLSNGRHYLAIPGPSVLPAPVLRAMQRPAPNIYTGALVDLTDSLVPDLKTVAGGADNVAMYICNGHGVWEASLSNIATRGDRVLCLVTGYFGAGWVNVARGLGLDAEVLDFGSQAEIDFDQVEAALRADSGHAFKAVICVHADTSTSGRNDIAGVRKAIDAAAHPALFMVDCIASMGCDPFLMRDWGVDVAITASQKGLMTPAGMGFVFFSDKAKAAQIGDLCSPYWDWRVRAEAAALYNYFDGTAPTQHLYALRAALDMMMEEGMAAIWARHDHLARAYWAAFEAWGAGGNLRMHIADPDKRSRAVTALSLPAPLASELRRWMEDTAGVTLGISLGLVPMDDPAWHGYFRVGHMGHINAHMVMGVLGTMDAGFKALGIAHGEGAVSAAAQVMAGS
jgi:alanine-glyoxylate transaminase / serine-glyoxylate transaminase / serine-pyruvate transaminase